MSKENNDDKLVQVVLDYRGRCFGASVIGKMMMKGQEIFELMNQGGSCKIMKMSEFKKLEWYEPTTTN